MPANLPVIVYKEGFTLLSPPQVGTYGVEKKKETPKKKNHKKFKICSSFSLTACYTLHGLFHGCMLFGFLSWLFHCVLSGSWIGSIMRCCLLHTGSPILHLCQKGRK
eukprot:Rmarinus@m.17154